VVGSSAVLAKSIYELSLQVLKEGSSVPYFQFVALGAGVIATAYYSWNLVALGEENKASEKVIHVSPRPGSAQDQKEISAFHPGEFVGPAKGASQ
jgi:hypothetical protein